MLKEHSPLILESTATGKEKEAIKRQESLYEQAGLTPKKITDSTVKIGEKLRARVGADTIPMSEGLYLTSSDSLHSLSKAQVKDQKVLTVAGSGEFAQVFASLGAEKVDAFDISPFACFMDELKWSAAKTLSFQDYRRFMRAEALMDSRGNLSELMDAPVVDRDLYEKLRDSLTSQAQAYFDEILGGEYAQDFLPLRHVDYHFHFRRSRTIEEGYTKVPYLKDEKTWQAFQDRIKDKQTKILCSDVNDIPDFSDYDYCYISNIAYYRDEQMEVIRNMLRKGAKRIGFSMNVSEARLPYWQNLIDHQGNSLQVEDYPLTQKLKERRIAEMREKGPASVYFGKDTDWHGEPLPGAIGIRAKIINLDFREDYCVYLEVTAEDNQDAIKLDNPFDNP